MALYKPKNCTTCTRRNSWECSGRRNFNKERNINCDVYTVEPFTNERKNGSI